jgi:phosphohistidine phosphatase
MLKLILLRHAKTEKTSPTGLDFDRPLAQKGHKQARAMAMHLAEIKFTETTVFCSDAKRTQETFQHLRQDNDFQSYHFNHDLYLASRETLLQLLCKQHDTTPILVIGHNDGLSDLATHLTDSYLHLDTCTLLTLDVHVDEWQSLSAGTCTIAGVYRPV